MNSRLISSYALLLIFLSSLGLASAAFGENINVSVSETERRLLQAFGPWPQKVPPDPGNELSGIAWAEKLGERLFSETAFSGSNKQSCASCHIENRAFTDGLTVGAGAGLHVRNTQGLLDVGLQRWFGWDGGTDSLWAASLRPILSDIELNGDFVTIATRLRAMPATIKPLRDAGYDIGNDEALVVASSKSIAAYVRTLQSGRTAFDDYRDAVVAGRENQADYPENAKRGLSVFFGDANCHVCHFGANFSNQEFHDTGRPFFTGVGQVDPGRYSGIKRVRSDPYNLKGRYNGTETEQEILKTDSVTLSQANFGQWRTPSLRNLVYTAPYMHDGSLTTLRDVVDAYADIDPDRIHSDGEAIIKPLNLTEQERNDLVAFLRSLSSDATRLPK